MPLKLLQKDQFQKQQKQLVISNTKLSRASQQNDIKTVKSDTENAGLDREISEEKHTSPEKKNRKLLILYKKIIIL